jgi:hypothetical protein
VATKNLLQVPAYNFVFINACTSSGDASLANAFGSTGTDQGFLGWTNHVLIDDAWDSWTTRLMTNLDHQLTLRDAVLATEADGHANGQPAGTFATPKNYGDGAMTVHGVYGSPSVIYTWFRPL